MHFVAGLAKRLGKPLSGAVKDEDPVRITQPYNQPRAAQSQAQTEGRRRLTLPTQQPAAVTKSRQEFADDEDDDDFDVDDSFMRRLEEVEAKAVKRAKLSNRDDEGRPERMEVIEISD